MMMWKQPSCQRNNDGRKILRFDEKVKVDMHQIEEIVSLDVYVVSSTGLQTGCAFARE